MRLLLLIILLTTGTLTSAHAYTPPIMNIIDEGSGLEQEAARKKFQAAWRTCMTDGSATKNDAAFVSCMNRQLKQTKLHVVIQ